MPLILDYDIETDYAYQRGLQKGVEKGIWLAKKEAIIEMLKDSFLSIEQIAKYQSTSEEEVLAIKEELEKE